MSRTLLEKIKRSGAFTVISGQNPLSFSVFKCKWSPTCIFVLVCICYLKVSSGWLRKCAERRRNVFFSPSCFISPHCGNRGGLFIKKGQQKWTWMAKAKKKEIAQLRLCPRLPVKKEKKKKRSSHSTATECGSSQKYSRQEIPHSPTGLKGL